MDYQVDSVWFDVFNIIISQQYDYEAYFYDTHQATF